MVGNLVSAIVDLRKRDALEIADRLRRGEKVEPQRTEEGAIKRFFKSVFFTVSGDLNEIT
jgi:hypothetical protein